MKINKWALGYAAGLAALTIYMSLDTFVFHDVYEQNATLSNSDMFENIEYSSYIDHLWDLDLNDPKQKEYYDIVEENFDDLSSVPDFFAWVNLAKEDNEE